MRKKALRGRFFSWVAKKIWVAKILHRNLCRKLENLRQNLAPKSAPPKSQNLATKIKNSAPQKSNPATKMQTKKKRATKIETNLATQIQKICATKI